MTEKYLQGVELCIKANVTMKLKTYNIFSTIWTYMIDNCSGLCAVKPIAE